MMAKTDRKPGNKCLAKMDVAVGLAVAMRECVRDVAKRVTVQVNVIGAEASAEASVYSDRLVEMLHDARADLAAAMVAAGVPFTPRRKRSGTKAGKALLAAHAEATLADPGDVRRPEAVAGGGKASRA